MLIRFIPFSSVHEKVLTYILLKRVFTNAWYKKVYEDDFLNN